LIRSGEFQQEGRQEAQCFLKAVVFNFPLVVFLGGLPLAAFLLSGKAACFDS